jgi:hypothetical protein
MATTYLMHKTVGWVGHADLPEWINFDEKPPRSFEVYWDNIHYSMQGSTTYVVPITKEVYDIMRSV